MLVAGYKSVFPSLGPLHMGENQSVREPILLKDDPILGSELEAKITMEMATPTLLSTNNCLHGLHGSYHLQPVPVHASQRSAAAQRDQ